MPAAAVAAVGIGVSAVNGANQAKAAKKAGQQQVQATNDALAFQKQQYNNAQQIFAKYGVQGDWARNQIAAFVGAPQSGQGAQGQPNYQKYLADNPDVAQAFANDPNAQAQFNGDANAYAKYHYDTYGKNEGRQLAGTEGTDSYKTPDQLREDAWATYEKSPWATIAKTSANKAKDSFLSMAGAQGGALSGRTARGLAEVSNEMEQQGFGSYMSELGGLADQGFQADTAAASGGQTYANNASNLTVAAGQAKANATTGAADAYSSALSDAAGWAGWGVGQMGANTSQKVYSSQTGVSGPSQSGRKRTGAMSGFTLQ